MGGAGGAGGGRMGGDAKTKTVTDVLYVTEKTFDVFFRLMLMPPASQHHITCRLVFFFFVLFFVSGGGLAGYCWLIKTIPQIHSSSKQTRKKVIKFNFADADKLNICEQRAKLHDI